MTHEPIVWDPPPEPPSIATRSSLLFAGLGVFHLVLAALFECLQLLHLVVGLLEILLAVVIAVLVSGWRKRHDAWSDKERAIVEARGRSAPPPTHPA